ncbi:hypothetical protein Tco_1215324 [Tanacetum coccineum]
MKPWECKWFKDKDKNATLQDFDEALDLQCVETASQSPLNQSKIQGDDVITFCDDVKREIDHAAGGKFRDKNAEESWEIIENLALYDRKSWDDPRDFAKLACTKRMERFKEAIYKKREDINERMIEMFSLLKELRKGKSLEKVLVREEVNKPITKYVNTISLVRTKNEKDKGGDEVVDKSLVDPLEPIENDEPIYDVMDNKSNRREKNRNNRWGNREREYYDDKINLLEGSDIYTTRIVMKNHNPLNEPNEAIPEENPVILDPNQVVDVHDPNEMVDILDDIDLVNYDGDNEENPKEDPEEDPEEELEPNNGLVNQSAPHVDPHQPDVMIGWLEENDGVNEGVNNEDIEDEDVEIELDDDAELIFPYEMGG